MSFFDSKLKRPIAPKYPGYAPLRAALEWEAVHSPVATRKVQLPKYERFLPDDLVQSVFEDEDLGGILD